MKPRHAAALALVGWYLMAPPVTSNSKWGGDLRASLQKWIVILSFDNATDCERARFEQMKSPDDSKLFYSTFAPLFGRDDPESSGTQSLIAYEMRVARCITTDDPRLVPRWPWD